MISEYFSISFKNLKRRKLRSWLTLLGIFISIAVIFLLISLSIGLNESINEQFRQFGTDKFYIQAKGALAGPGTAGAVELTEDDAKVVEKISGVKGITYFSIASSEVSVRNQKRFFQVIGVPLDNFEVFLESGFYKLDEGGFLDNGDNRKAMIGSQYKLNNIFENPVEVGDTIKLNSNDFRVKGIMQPIGSPQDDRLVTISLEDFREIFPENGRRIDQIIVQIEPGEDINDIASKVEKKLRSFRDVDKDNQDFTILTPEELLRSFGTVLNILTGFLLGVALISLLVGSIGIANTMYTSVLERTKEIGVMKSVGAKNSNILFLFTIESGLLGLVGGFIGVFFGGILGKLIEYIASVQLGFGILKVAINPYLVVGCLIFSFLIGALSGMLPAWKASLVKPIEALRYE